MKILTFAPFCLLSLYILADLFILNGSSCRIAYVDNNLLLSEYKGMADAKEELKGKIESWEANVDTLSFKLQEAIADFEKETAGVSAKQRAEREAILKVQQTNLRNYQVAIKQKITKAEQDLLLDVIPEIDVFIKQYGEENGYAYILGATNTGNIVYANSMNDITQIIIDELNSRYTSK